MVEKISILPTGRLTRRSSGRAGIRLLVCERQRGAPLNLIVRPHVFQSHCRSPRFASDCARRAMSGIDSRAIEAPIRLAPEHRGRRWCHAHRVARRTACFTPRALLVPRPSSCLPPPPGKAIVGAMLLGHAPAPSLTVWPNLAVNTDAPSAALRAGRGAPVTLIR